MSEYQYYEFQAIDRPLDEQALGELRALSSRAEITPTRLVNVYNYGDFRGDPKRLMEKYFDAFVYVANWGTHRLMLRLPRRLVDAAAIKPYDGSKGLTVWEKGAHVLLDFCSEEEESSGWEEGEGRLSSLLPVRNELLAGDFRALYLGWLVGVSDRELDDKAREPPVPPGLRKLSASLKALAEFLRIDPVWIEAAAEAATGVPPGEPSVEALPVWLETLPVAEKDAWLLRLLQGESPHLRSELLQQFRRAHAAVAPIQVSKKRRTVAELQERAEVLRQEKEDTEAKTRARAQARQVREQTAARSKYLDTLAGREGEIWGDVEAAIASKKPKEYKRAIGLLQDLRDLDVQANRLDRFAQQLQQLCGRHGSKRSFLQQLAKVGLSP